MRKTKVQMILFIAVFLAFAWTGLVRSARSEDINLSGTWKGTWRGKITVQDLALHLTQEGRSVHGTFDSGTLTSEPVEGTFEGNILALRFRRGGFLKATVSGDQMEGEVRTQGVAFGGGKPAEFSVKRAER